MIISHQEQKKPGIELLRIFMMLWIILFHYSDHGAVDMQTAPFCINWVWLSIARIGGGIGNCVFVLISGYLLWGKRFKAERLLKLMIQVWMFSVFCSLISLSASTDSISRHFLLTALFPVLTNEYWYMTCYVVLYLLFPFINRLLENISEKQHLYLVGIMLTVFSVIPTFTLTRYFTSEDDLWIFLSVYIVGTYLRRSEACGFGIKRNCLLALAAISLMIGSEIVLKLLGVSYFQYFVWGMCKSPVIITSVLLLLCFLNLSIPLSKYVYAVSSSVFGVYLFHIGKLWKLLFLVIFNNYNIFYSTIPVLFHMIASAILIFSAGIILELVRKATLEKLIFKNTFVLRFLGKADIFSSLYIPGDNSRKNI